MSILKTRENPRTITPWTQEPFMSMRDLLNWNPFRESMGLMDTAAYAPTFEVKETPTAYVFKADIPGIREEDLSVELANNRLVVSGKREEEKKEDNETYHLFERSYGSFSRSFSLPEDVHSSKVDAHLRDGVLTVTVVKSPEAKPQKIQIQS